MASRNWFLTNRSTFGNAQWSFKHIFFPVYCVSALTSITMLVASYDFELMHSNLSLLFDVILYMTPHIICWILWRRTPQFADLVFIRQEMKYLNIGVLSSLLVYLLSIIIFGILVQSVYWTITVASFGVSICHCM